jgi:hypothetical protein
MLKRLTQKPLMKLWLISVLACGVSCGTTRVVFIHESKDVVRLGPDVRGKVYFYREGQWVLSKNKVTLPEGWYAGQLDGAGGTSSPPGPQD